MGICEPPNEKKKVIAFNLRPSDSEEESLSVLLHEMLHAAFWDLDEDSVDEASTDIARVLIHLGYRPTQPLPGVKHYD